VPYPIPKELDRPLFTLFATSFPMYRGFMMLVALSMLAGTWLVLTRTRIGLVIQAALTHPEAAEALGHNVPRIFMWVFGGGCALAGLAGVIGGNAFVTEPGMAATVGSLAGAFIASILIGVLQTFAVALDYSMMSLLNWAGAGIGPSTPGYSLLKVTIAQSAAILPFLLLVLILIFRPKGLMGTRE
jgi:branched-chain amino acid transport system permease protein